MNDLIGLGMVHKGVVIIVEAEFGIQIAITDSKLGRESSGHSMEV